MVVSEETVDKVTLFCAAKRNGGVVAKQGTDESVSMQPDGAATANGQIGQVQGSFEFGDFIRAFKVRKHDKLFFKFFKSFLF